MAKTTPLNAIVATAAGLCLAITVLGRASDEAEWWSERALVRPAVPVIENAGAWVTNPIDAFVLHGLETRGLTPAPPADRAALIRRATYDLTGLPPTPEEVEAFVRDEAPDAYDRLLDRLLDSAHYGEAWGRHWLDLVRYAETDSYERDRTKPSAWRYRQYVIDAFNADTPYDRFLIEQLAGDELEDGSIDTLIATGYYRLGIWDDEPTDSEQAVFDDYDGIIDTTARVMLGVSLGCARCHTHKGDPIPHEEYYEFLAFFRGIKPYKEGGGNNITPRNFVRQVRPPEAETRYAADMAAYEAERARMVETLAAYAPSADAVAARDAAWQRGLVLDSGGFDRPPGDTPQRVPGGHNLTANGEVRIDDGRFGEALRFDGKDDYIQFPRMISDDFTIAFWLRTTSGGSGGDDTRWFLGEGLVDAEVPGIVDDFGVSLVGRGRIAAGTGRPETFIHSPEGFNDGVWHHVAFTRHMGSGEIVLYVDGEPVDRAIGSRNPLNTPEHITVGRMLPGVNFLDGDLDDLRIYERTLTPHEVLGLAEPSADPALDLDDAWRERVSELADLRRPQLAAPIEVLCVQEVGATPPATHVLRRGNVHLLGDEVTPSYPAIVDASEPVLTPAPDGATSSGRRLAFARWLTQPDHPRTSRVMMNRIWQYHFGEALCPTPNDFGRLGLEPSDPVLLDWLATEFVARGWSMKAMHRLIMTSSAYRMSATFNEHAYAADPTNDLHWRFDIRRLTAEELRDSVLTASGAINLDYGGPSVYPPIPEEVLATSSRPGDVWRVTPDQATRRSIYIHVKRSLLTPLLVAFDLADTDQSCPVRFNTTQPTQALSMVNSDFMNEQAGVFAQRLRDEVPGDLRGQVVRGLALVTSRTPDDEDVSRSLELIDDLMREEHLGEPEALRCFCLMALNLNEFLYLD